MTTDWQAVKEQYEFSGESLRAIGEAHGVSHTAIRKRAEAEGWKRQKAEIVAVISRKPDVKADETRRPITNPVNLLNCPRCKGPGDEEWYLPTNRRTICWGCRVQWPTEFDGNLASLFDREQHDNLFRNKQELAELELEEVTGISNYQARPRERQLGPPPTPIAYEV